MQKKYTQKRQVNRLTKPGKNVKHNLYDTKKNPNIFTYLFDINLRTKPEVVTNTHSDQS